MKKKSFRVSTAILIVLFVPLFSFFTACKTENDESPIDSTHADRVYNSTVIDVFEPDYYTEICKVFRYDDYYYLLVSLLEFDFQEDSLVQYYIYKCGASGDIVDKMQLPSNLEVYKACDIVNDSFMFITSEGVGSLDLDTGEVKSVIKNDISYTGVCSCSDGYVIISIGCIEKYDSDNKLEAKVSDPAINMFYGNDIFWEEGNQYYVITCGINDWRYYQIDFNSGSCSLLLNVKDVIEDIGKTSFCSGPYIFSDKGEFKYDIQEKCLYQLSDYNNYDIVPPVGGLISSPTFAAFDDDNYAEMYYYGGQLAQVVLYSYDPNRTNEERIKIVVGGHGCRSDLALNTAIYRFNTSQDEYRAVIDDYSENPEFARLDDAASRAALFKYFDDGNAPDIFCGYSFDYEELYKNGTTQNITPYMEDDFVEITNKFIPSVRDLMFDEDGNCSNLFSGFQVIGYSCYEGRFEDPSDVTLEDASELGEELGLDLFYPESSASMAAKLINTTDGSVSYDEVYSVLNYCYAHGYPSDYYMSLDYSYDKCLLFNCALYSVEELSYVENDIATRIDYIGFPTMTGAVHCIDASGAVGLSSGTDYPYACVQLMSYMFARDVQVLNYQNSLLPVNEEVLFEYLDYSEDHDLIPESDYNAISYFSNCYEASVEAREDLYDAILSADKVYSYDWGAIAIITEEVESYYNAGKSIEDVAQSLTSRLNLYLDENGEM